MLIDRERNPIRSDRSRLLTDRAFVTRKHAAGRVSVIRVTPLAVCACSRPISSGPGECFRYGRCECAIKDKNRMSSN